MKLKILLALVGIFASTGLANAVQNEAASYGEVIWSGAKKYGGAAGEGAFYGALLPAAFWTNIGLSVTTGLDRKAEYAESTAAKYGYQALSGAAAAASLLGAIISTKAASPTLAALGGTYEVAREAYKDIAYLLSEIKTKLDNNKLTPQEAAKLAEQLEAETKELKEHAANPQQTTA